MSEKYEQCKVRYRIIKLIFDVWFENDIEVLKGCGIENIRK